MDGKRQARISRLIQKELSEIFRRQTAKLGGVMVSVSAVKVTPDLSIARAYLSIFPSARSAEILENIKRQQKTVRYELAQHVRETLRKCPELQFYLDDSLDYVENIDRLLAQGRKSDTPEVSDVQPEPSTPVAPPRDTESLTISDTLPEED